MTQRTANPENAQQVLLRLRPGDEVEFSPGLYLQPLLLSNKSATIEQPIILRGTAGACISAGLSADDFRREANARAKRLEEQNRYPGLYPWLLDGRLKLVDCQNVIIKGFAFERAWPTHVALSNCRNIAIQDCDFLDATFAIGAGGENTYGITIDRCTWTQDRIPKRLWQEIPWWRIHGDRRDGYPPVDIDRDWRLFDGDFFRGDGIRGGVHIRDCTIFQAFNAIHLFNDALDPRLSIDVDVHGCTFVEIRDNVLEAEKVAQNWWFYHNEIHDCHKWFSFECIRSRFFYLFGNRCWFSSLQGTDDPLDHRGGGTFKLGKVVRLPYGPHYFFHNSISSRSDYARKGVLPGLQHLNNAVRFARPDDPLYTGPADVFGDLSAPPGCIKKRFTSEWKRYGIDWRNDVVLHPNWPGTLRNARYPIGPPDLGLDPAFKKPFEGNFKLRDRQPCGNASSAGPIMMPDGECWPMEGGQDIGAWQGKTLFAGPQFRPVTNPLAGLDAP